MALLIHLLRTGKRQIRSSSRRLQDVLDAAMDAIVAVDEQGRVAYFNDSAEAMFGISRDLRTPLTTILGYTQMILADGYAEDRVRERQYIANISSAGKQLRETVDRLLAISQAGSMVNETQGNRHHLFDLAPDMICIGRDGRISSVNQAGVDMIGAASPGDVIGRRWIEVQRPHSARRRRLPGYGNRASSPEEAIGDALKVVCAHTGWPVGHAYMVDGGGVLRSSRIWHFDHEQPYRELRQVTEASIFKPGEGLPGRVMQDRDPIWIPDINSDPNFPRAHLLRQTDIRSVIAFPVLIGETVLAVLELFSPKNERPDDLLFNALNQIGTQLGRVIEREDAEALLIRRANFDPRTALPNRALVMDRLTQALQTAVRDGQSVVVVSVDLDDFKKVNDTLGHATGDRLIIEAARRLERSLRKSDTVARLGGDEFLIIFKDIQGSERAGELADKLLRVHPARGKFRRHHRDRQLAHRPGLPRPEGDEDEKFFRASRGHQHLAQAVHARCHSR